MILAVIVIVLALLLVREMLMQRRKPPPISSRTVAPSSHSLPKSTEKAGKAALQRYQVWQNKQRERKKAYQRKRQEQESEFYESTKHINDEKRKTYEQESLSLPVYDDGLTVFRHMPHLPQADLAAAMLQRLAQEFMPILRERGYNVRSVSEFCCCGDGLDYELGGHVHFVIDPDVILMDTTTRHPTFWDTTR